MRQRRPALRCSCWPTSACAHRRISVRRVSLQVLGHLQIAADDLMEVLGALMENATRFARRQVRVAGHADGQVLELAVEDDGPGLNISTEEALSRGGRLDETGSGNHGLGLSIARDIIEATQGQLALGTSDLGGLQVRLQWAALVPTA